MKRIKGLAGITILFFMLIAVAGLDGDFDKKEQSVFGALSDEALIRYNRFPTISFDERIKMYQELEGVDEVIVQNTIMYDDVIKKLKPDYVVHGDNWREGAESVIRENVLSLLSEYGGELIEVPYTYNEKVRKIDSTLKEKLAMPEY